VCSHFHAESNSLNSLSEYHLPVPLAVAYHHLMCPRLCPFAPCPLHSPPCCGPCPLHVPPCHALINACAMSPHTLPLPWSPHCALVTICTMLPCTLQSHAPPCYAATHATHLATTTTMTVVTTPQQCNYHNHHHAPPP
jgi:hypothetical protein